jgi:catechol 2,3-dioxygenase
MDTEKEYKIPDHASIGHVHLKVSDLERSLDFYCKVLGFSLSATYGNEAAFVSAGGYHHHIGLNIWHTKNSQPAPFNRTGLYHVAILYPSRKDLARALQRLIEKGYPLDGAADHGVSEAIYLEDPDKNGLELYWDRPREQWTYDDDGSVQMYTRPLDTEDLLGEINT